MYVPYYIKKPTEASFLLIKKKLKYTDFMYYYKIL